MVSFCRLVGMIWLSCLGSVWAWNALGHRLIAQIALDHVTPSTQQVLYRYHRAFHQTTRRHESLVASAVWLDRLYQRELAPWRAMHYIDLGFSDEPRSYMPPFQPINALWAIRLAQYVLQNPQASALEKDIALRIAMHVIADIHQPLHATTRVSYRYPLGDRGGNLVKLRKNPIAPNLHAYWDRAAGLWSKKRFYSAHDIKKIAKRMEQAEPCTSELILSPTLWAMESHHIAIDLTYHALPANHQPDRDYQRKAQAMAEHRMLQAGCRLAAWLNVWVN